MKRAVLTLYAFICLSGISFSQFRLEVSIAGIHSNTGNIMLQVFDEKENVIRQEISSVKNEACVIKITGLKPGRYALRYYHDENLNGKMETNVFGKPLEGYGFSNNVTGKFGPPPFEKWLFDVNEDKKMVLKINY